MIHELMEKGTEGEAKGEITIPYRILNVMNKDFSLHFTDTKATADFIVDILEDYWLSNIDKLANKNL